MLTRCQAVAAGRRTFRFKNTLARLDASVIDLCATLFDWATFRGTTGAVKLHLRLDHDGDPAQLVITEGRQHEGTVATTLPFAQGTILVIDRGDVEDAWFAALYKDRWQIELLFKALKQHLTIKTFVGTSATALHTQIWTALIALVLTYLQLRSTFGWSLSNLVALLQFQLFTHRDLWAWLNEPFTGPPAIEAPEQLVLTAVA
ncbi:MAG TPA: transposase [Candidatus Methylomirabilis sp.]|nr:transposase [Candidatus Methylomirabilis sp.]